MTFDCATVKALVNGVVTREIAGLSGIVATTTGPFKIGSRADVRVDLNPLRPFDGLIDEVEVFDRALSDGEVYDIYRAGSNGKCK